MRARRLELGISAKELSEQISLFGGESVVGNIESVSTSLKYTTSTLRKAVEALDWTLKDVLPNELLDDDTLQDKTCIPILKGMSIKAALNSLLEQGFFDEPHDIKAVTAYYNTFFKPEDQKVDSDFSAQLEDLYNEGKLTKIPADRPKGETRLKFVRKGDSDIKS